MMSKRSSLRQNIRHDAKNTPWRQKFQNARHYVKKHVMTTKCSSLLQEVRYDIKRRHIVNKFVMTSKALS